MNGTGTERPSGSPSAARPDHLSDRVIERSVLGQLWTEPERLAEVSSTLRPEHFTDPALKVYYEAMLETRQRLGDAPPGSFANPAFGDWYDRRDEVLVGLLEDAGMQQAAETARSAPRSILAVAPEWNEMLDGASRVLVHRAEVRAEVAAASLSPGGTSLDAKGAAADRALPPLPSYPPPPAEPPAQPTLVVVAGPEGGGPGAVAHVARRHLAGRPVVELGHGYPPDHPAYEAVQRAAGGGPAARHLAAAQYAMGQGAHTVLHTTAADPKALAEDVREFQRAGYRVEFAAVVTPEPLRRLNVLEAHLSDPFATEPPARARDRLGESADLAQALGARVRVFRPDGTAVGTAALVAGDRAPSQVVDEVGARTWSDATSLRAAARTARLMARAGTPAVQEAVREAARDARRHGTENWNWALDMAADVGGAPHWREEAARWGGAGRRVRLAGPLVARSDTELGELLESGMARYRTAHERADRADREAKGLRATGRTAEASAASDRAAFARESAQTCRESVVAVLGEERRRAGLTPGQRQAELRAVQQRVARAQARVGPPPPRPTAIGVAAPAPARPAAARR